MLASLKKRCCKGSRKIFAGLGFLLFAIVPAIGSAIPIAQLARSVANGPAGSLFYAVAKDASGNTYVVGELSGNSIYDFGNGVTLTGAYASGANAILVKYDSSGVVQWARSVASGPDTSSLRSVSVDASGNIYAGGFTGKGSYNFGNGVTITGDGNFDNLVLVKYNSAGIPQWAKGATSGGYGSTSFFSVGVDPSGNIYAVGRLSGSYTYNLGDGVTVKGSASGSDNLVLAKYNSNGVTQWAKSVTSGSKSSTFWSVAVDPSGNIYAGGTISSDTYGFGNGITATSGTGFQAVLVKYDSNGNAQWAKTTVAGYYSTFDSVAVDASGNIYGAGYVGKDPYGSTYDFGDGVAISGINGNSIVLVKYSSSGVAQWAKSVINSTSSHNSDFNSITVDPSGNIYGVGRISGTETYDLGNSVTLTGSSSSASNAMLIKYNSSGVVQWAKNLGSSELRAVTTDLSENLYAVGLLNKGITYDLGNVTVTGPLGCGSSPVLIKYNSNGLTQMAKSLAAVTGVLNTSSFNSVAVDLSGNTYAVGYLTGNYAYNFGDSNVYGFDDSAVKVGAYSGGSNSVLVKYRGGIVQWVKGVVQGSGSSHFNSVAGDSSGNIYVAGDIAGATSYDFGLNSVGMSVTVAGGYAGGENSVLVKYNTNGVIQWAKSVTGGAGQSIFKAVVVDASGNSYAIGSIFGSGSYNFGDGVTVAGTSAGENLVLVKYNSNGTTQWAKSVSSTERSNLIAGALDANGNLYAVGELAKNGAYDLGNGVTVTGGSGYSNAVLVKYNSSGVAQWARGLASGPASSHFNAVAVASNGSIYVAGDLYGTGIYDLGNGVTVAGAYASGENVLLAQYDNNGVAQWAKSVTSGSSISYFTAIKIDDLGKIYVVGNISGIGPYVFGTGVSAAGIRSYNPVLVKYDNNGNAEEARSVLSGPDNSSFNSVAGDGNGNLYTVGNIFGSGTYNFGNNITVAGAYATGSNSLLVKYQEVIPTVSSSMVSSIATSLSNSIASSNAGTLSSASGNLAVSSANEPVVSGASSARPFDFLWPFA